MDSSQKTFMGLLQEEICKQNRASIFGFSKKILYYCNEYIQIIFLFF